MLNEIMLKQAELQKRLGTDFSNMADKERAEFMRNHRGYLADELAEALYEMPEYKLWKDYSEMGCEAREVAWQKVRMELIDCLHFFVNLLLCAGMTAEEVHHMYMAKNAENHRRQDEGYTADKSYREQAVEDVLAPTVEDKHITPTCTVTNGQGSQSSDKFIAMLLSDDGSCNAAMCADIITIGVAASILQAKYSDDLQDYSDADKAQIEKIVAETFNNFNWGSTNEKD